MLFTGGHKEQIPRLTKLKRIDPYVLWTAYFYLFFTTEVVLISAPEENNVGAI